MMGVQTVSGAHTRLVVLVGGTLWYCEEEQDVRMVHTRSEKKVGGMRSYSLPLQTV